MKLNSAALAYCIKELIVGNCITQDHEDVYGDGKVNCKIIPKGSKLVTLGIAMTQKQVLQANSMF